MPTPKISTITTYDALIKHSASRILHDVDWRLVKAQLYQESQLKTNAVSPAGAQGIAQFMPGTWAEIKEKIALPQNASPFNATHAIPALCFYMAELHSKWTAKREDADRYALTLASYNAGMGHLITAQALAGGPAEYNRIIARLHEVTGDKKAAETRTYVEKIFGYFTAQILEG